MIMLQYPATTGIIKREEDSLVKGFQKFEDEEINDDILKIARRDLGETPEVVDKSLTSLRQMNEEQCEKFQMPTEDSELIKFLRVTKFDVPKAYCRIKKFYTLGKRYAEIFSDLYPSNCEKAINQNLHDVLPYRDSDGSPILVGMKGHWDPKQFSFDEYMQLDVMTVTAILISPINQICGAIFLVDCDNLAYSQLYEYTPSRIWMMVNVIQNTLPIRHKAIHVVNAPPFFSFFYYLFYPLLSKKLRKRIIVHPRDPEFRSLHRYISPSILPENYGGKLGPMNNDAFKTWLHSKEEYFKSLSKYLT